MWPENAISASTRDPRFDPIRPHELPMLEINVDVLSDAEDIKSKDELENKYEDTLNLYDYNITDEEVHNIVHRIITEKVSLNDTTEVKKFL